MDMAKKKEFGYSTDEAIKFSSSVRGMSKICYAAMKSAVRREVEKCETERLSSKGASETVMFQLSPSENREAAMEDITGWTVIFRTREWGNGYITFLVPAVNRHAVSVTLREHNIRFTSKLSTSPARPKRKRKRLHRV